MKCDICGTKIPTGKKVCPQCGYRIYEKYASEYDSSGNSHEHIKKTYSKVDTESLKKMNFGKDKIQAVILMVIVLGIFISVAIFAVPRFMRRHMDPILSTSLQGMIDEGYANDGTLLVALDTEKEVKQFLENIGLDCRITEKVGKDKNDMDFVNVTIQTEVDSVKYELFFGFKDVDWTLKTMRVTYESSTPLHQMELLDIDTDMYNRIARFMGITYSPIKEVEKILPKMQSGQEGQYYGFNYNLFIEVEDNYNKEENTYLNTIYIENHSQYTV